MNILLVQADINCQSPVMNCERLATLVSGAGSADMIVLPEMFATGFIAKPSGTPGKDGDRLLDWMRKLACECDAAVAGSAIAEDSGLFYNRCYFVRPDGSFEFYDKRHLFSPGGEDKGYTAGRERVIVEWAGFRILLQVCYDLRFPVFSRNRGDYDMALYVGNWPRTRRKVWDVLLRARAIENACYVAGVNRVGRDTNSDYDGGTCLVDFRGDVAGMAADNKEETLLLNADIDKLRDFRNGFRVLDDADCFDLRF